MSDPQRRRAHDFLTTLSDAIAAAVDDAGPDALRYRGAGLGPAMERGLFVAFSNDAALYDAFADGAGLAVNGVLERAVAERLLDGPVTGPGAVRRLWAGLGERRLLGRMGHASSSSAAGFGDPPAGETWFVLDHPKFLPLVEPIAGALDQAPARILWADAALRPAARAGDPALDEAPGAEPSRMGDAGRALRGHAGLLATYDRLLAALRALAPRRLVVVEGNSPLDALVGAAGETLDVPVVCVQNGWSPIVHAGFRRMPYRRMCVWGEGFAELLAPHNPSLELVATGHPTLSGDIGAPAEQPTAGFFLQPGSPYNAPAHLVELDALVDAVAEAAPQARVLVREHPGYPAPTRPRPVNVEAANAPQVALRDVLSASRVAVSIYSTSLVEATALGRPAVSLNRTALPRLSPDLQAEGAGIETADPAAACEAIVGLLQPGAGRPYEAGMARIRDRYFDGLRPGAAARAAGAIMEV